MASRQKRGPSREYQRGRPSPRDFPEAEELASRDLDIENKKFILEVKSNEQGRFVKILETQTQGRGRIIFSADKASTFRSILTKMLEAYQNLAPAEDISESERLETESFSQGRRRYYVDLRQNSRGRFLKLTMLAGGKTFIAIPGEGLAAFHDAFVEVMEEAGETGDAPADLGESPRPVASSRSAPSSRPASSPPPPAEPLPDSREVHAGPKKFFFDVARNDRGYLIRLSEVQRSRRVHLNIPHSCWSKMAEVFQAYVAEVPASGDESSGSASEDT